jgi:hypothetical protein
VRTPSPKVCWWPNDPASSLAAVPAGGGMHPQHRPCGPGGPHRCHGERVDATGGVVAHSGPRHGGRPVRQPWRGVRRAWKGAARPRGWTRRHARVGDHTQKGNDMSIRRGWQATVGALDAVLRHLDGAQGADAQVRDGHRLERASLPEAYEAGTTNTGVWPARMTRSVTLPRKKRLKPL